MDQLGVVTTVLVLSTLLTSIDDIRKFWRRKFGPAPEAAPAPEQAVSTDVPSPGESIPAGGLIGVLMADLESEDERRVHRALSLIEKAPADRVTPPLVQMLRHPRDEVAARAAAALLRFSSAEALEPLYLYFNARAARAVSRETLPAASPAEAA